MQAAESYVNERLDHLGIVAGVCQEIGLASWLDEQDPMNRQQVSVGTATTAMILNGLGFSNRQLYLVPQYFANKPVEHLLGRGIAADMLNDDYLGRTLDWLCAHDPTRLFAGIARRARQVFGIQTKQIHVDTTSFPVSGEYAQAKVQAPQAMGAEEAAEAGEPALIAITYGYSRDHREDLKQWMLALATTHDGNIPLFLQPLGLVSYTRFVALIPQMMIPLLAYLQSRYGDCTGMSFIDSTSLEVCDPKRISGHHVFATDARRAVSSMGWFFGFKLHLAVNDRGDLLACCLTPGNVDDRAPVPQMVKRLRGKLFGDRGYISAPLTQLLFEQGLQLINRLRENMKNHLKHFSDKLLLRKRAIIETIIDQLKNISRIEHSRHRSPANFVVHLIAGLLAYSHQDKKPGLHLDEHALLAA